MESPKTRVSDEMVDRLYRESAEQILAATDFESLFDRLMEPLLYVMDGLSIEAYDVETTDALVSKFESLLDDYEPNLEQVSERRAFQHHFLREFLDIL